MFWVLLLIRLYPTQLSCPPSLISWWSARFELWRCCFRILSRTAQCLFSSLCCFALHASYYTCTMHTVCRTFDVTCPLILCSPVSLSRLWVRDSQRMCSGTHCLCCGWPPSTRCWPSWSLRHWRELVWCSRCWGHLRLLWGRRLLRLEWGGPGCAVACTMLINTTMYMLLVHYVNIVLGQYMIKHIYVRIHNMTLKVY